jgi:hypothetical protein
MVVYRKYSLQANSSLPTPSSRCGKLGIQVPAEYADQGFQCQTVLTIGPQQRAQQTRDGDVLAMYSGDYALPRQLADLGAKWLLIPNPATLKGTSLDQHPQTRDDYEVPEPRVPPEAASRWPFAHCALPRTW